MGLLQQARDILGANAAAWPPKRLSRALQGGGSFGAFTWGVLDRLLDEGEVEFDAISGASAGAGARWRATHIPRDRIEH